MKRFFLPLCRGLFWLATALFLGGLVLHFAGYSLTSALPYVRWFALADLVLGTAALFAARSLTTPGQCDTTFGAYLFVPLFLYVGTLGADVGPASLGLLFAALACGLALGLGVDRFYYPAWQAANLAYQTARLEKLIPALPVSDAHKARYHAMMQGKDGAELALLHRRLADPETISLV